MRGGNDDEAENTNSSDEEKAALKMRKKNKNKKTKTTKKPKKTKRPKLQAEEEEEPSLSSANRSKSAPKEPTHQPSTKLFIDPFTSIDNGDHRLHVPGPSKYPVRGKAQEHPNMFPSQALARNIRIAAALPEPKVKMASLKSMMANDQIRYLMSKMYAIATEAQWIDGKWANQQLPTCSSSIMWKNY